jgi:hypothetical protein
MRREFWGITTIAKEDANSHEELGGLRAIKLSMEW